MYRFINRVFVDVNEINLFMSNFGRPIEVVQTTNLLDGKIAVKFRIKMR